MTAGGARGPPVGGLVQVARSTSASLVGGGRGAPGDEGCSGAKDEGGEAQTQLLGSGEHSGGTHDVWRSRSMVPVVRWEGYHHSWEQWRIRGLVGTALETWEPRRNVLHSLAREMWEQQAA